jgi:hypothetical protein
LSLPSTLKIEAICSSESWLIFNGLHDIITQDTELLNAMWIIYVASIYLLIHHAHFNVGARCSVVGWGNMLQAGRSRVLFPMRKLDFSIDLILPATLWPWARRSL